MVMPRSRSRSSWSSHLVLHVAQCDGAGCLEQSVRERRLAVIDVRDDAEVADPVEAHQ